jgi:hypothetical protein
VVAGSLRKPPPPLKKRTRGRRWTAVVAALDGDGRVVVAAVEPGWSLLLPPKNIFIKIKNLNYDFTIKLKILKLNIK